jgi:predicted MPP superfamily phosphohydrolase
MSVVHLIIVLVFALDFYWWRLADRRLRPLRRARLWRGVLAVFMVGQILLMCSRLLPPAWSRRINGHVPLALIAGQYLWHLAVLPIAIVLGFAVRSAIGLRRFVGAAFGGGGVRKTVVSGDSRIPSAKADPTNVTNAVVHPTRRQVLSAAALAVPPLVLAGSVGVSLTQLGGYRVRSFDVKIPNLPPKLDGLMIAHLSDFHAGRFMTRRDMAPIIDTVNDMQPDLILVTGDLIDYALIDLPPALDALRRLRPKYGLSDGLAMCMGNHDCIENRYTFKRDCAAAGFRILANDARTIDVAGEKIQLMAVDWCKTDEMTNDALWRTSLQRDSAAFPILMAHHPHAFDQAAQLGFPLTLSGHTHGGQLMLTENIGVGSIKFRYLSGLYRKANGSQLIVSNGIGNWFPLRVNAPAEVLRLTLRRG